MGQFAADIMVTDFSFVDSDATVAEAEEWFEQDGITSLPVLNPDRTVFGLLTVKNLAGFHRRPLNNPHAFHAWEICDARPLVKHQSSTLDDITEAVLEMPRPHVLIVDDNQQLVGVISAEQLLHHWLASARGTLPSANRHRRSRAVS
ncbi:MAG: CBS domain-containing protein [Proteobacteria bacterium]|nr:CBS domain-containing protein [Pseudomonadota bacterium]